MAKRKEHDVGFDVDETITRLHQAALAGGAVPPDQPWAAKNPLATVLVHAFQRHGMQLEDRCTESPCRVGALCFALYEVLLYRDERDGARGKAVGAADAAEQLQSTLINAVGTYAARIAPLLRACSQRHKDEKQWGFATPAHAHDTLCVQPLEAMRKMFELIELLSPVANNLRAQVESPELRQSSQRKRQKLLRRAVYQHLAWGQLSEDEIAQLVPAEDGEPPGGRAERFRKRIEAPDARSLVPAEVALADAPEKSNLPDSSLGGACLLAAGCSQRR